LVKATMSDELPNSDQWARREWPGVVLGVRFVVCAVCICVCGLAAVCGSAQGLAARGRVLSASFASAGGGAGQLSATAGVAVEEATGDVYVVDRGNNRVERFGPHNEFISVWGWGVRDGKAEFEVCHSECQAGIAGGGQGQLHDPEAIAVDNSTSPSDPSRGDVYVVSDARAEHTQVVKFSGDGEPITAIKQSGSEPKWEGLLDGLAVDSSGRLWVYRGVEAEGFVERFTDASHNKFEETTLETSVLCPKPGFAVSNTGEAVYVDHERENMFGGCPAEEGESPRPVVAAALALSG
jgi:DNA-binding beta-propeller fold protein YncE